MAKLNIITLGSSKNYTDLAALGLTNVVVNDQNKTISFTLVADGSTRTLHFDQPKDGVSITNISIDANNNLVCTMSDGTEYKSKIDLLDNVYTKTETDTLLLDKAEKNHNHDSAYASKDTEHEHTNKETLDKFGVNDGGKLTFNGDVVTPEASDLSDYLKKTEAQNIYVAKETGKGLSENDFTTVLKDAYDKAVEDSHTHTNKSVIDKFSESADGALLYDGKSIEADLSTVYKKTETYSQTESDDKFVAKETGKGLSTNDYTTEEKDKLASLDNYDDTQVKTQIQAVANGLMDSVGYSADYKTIDIIAKNGVKKSVNVAPIISHASITELSDVDTTNKATGKALVYNATTSKHEYADVSATDEKVKMDASTDAKYLGELLDNVTIANENGELKVKKLDGQEVTITEINYLKGMTMNVMDLVNMFSNGGVKIINTPVATYAELLTLDKSSFIEGISYLVYVLADENHDNAKTTYLVDKDSETPTYFGFADSQRDFTTNPIDLATEITGKLGIANMDSDAIKALFTVDDTYKTETATNNAFSTHGAKALYDELLLVIGNKANSSDLTAHKDDTDIHVSTEDRTKWDSAKTHADSAHAPSNAQENVLETVKVNNQEITPDENKAVNIDLSDYAKTADIPTTLPANGGNSDTVNNHTVKSDVPTDAKFTDTVYDDTEVKGSIAELSSNLDALEYSDIAGGKNLANINDFKALTSNPSRYGYEWLNMKGGTYTFNITNGNNTLYIGYKHNGEFVNPISVKNGSKVQTITISDGDDILIWYDEGVTENTVTRLQLEVGSVATDYEPYIPSVKMLAEEVGKQNESLSVIGKCKNLLKPVFVSGWGCNCVIGDDGKITLTSTNTEDYQVVIGYIHKCSLKANKTYYFRAFDIINIDHIGIGKVGSDDLLKSFYNQLIYTPTEDMDIQLLIYFSDKTVGTISSCYISVSEVYTDEYVPYTGEGETLTHDVASLKNDLVASNAGAHNCVYRGKYLGNALTAEQKVQISAGTFNDLYIGDYWTIGGVNYRIAAFDYWWNSGDTQCTKHHVVIVPDTCLYNAKMSTTNVTTGAYIGSEMYTTNLEQAKTIINDAFGSENILSHREYLPNATKATTDPTYESAGSWYDSTVELMNERMVYGADVFRNIEVNGAIPTNHTIDKSQLPLFALEPSRICNRADWWLRDVVSSAAFALVDGYGSASTYHASDSYGVRPAFGITG